jgi:mannose-6-phosphate isomerase-like protein (cupin superfamily)
VRRIGRNQHERSGRAALLGPDGELASGRQGELEGVVGVQAGGRSTTRTRRHIEAPKAPPAPQNDPAIPRYLHDVFQTEPRAEFLYVISGRVALQVGDDPVELDEGDAVYFDSAREPRFSAAGDSAAAALVVMHG